MQCTTGTCTEVGILSAVIFFLPESEDNFQYSHLINYSEKSQPVTG